MTDWPSGHFEGQGPVGVRNGIDPWARTWVGPSPTHTLAAPGPWESQQQPPSGGWPAPQPPAAGWQPAPVFGPPPGLGQPGRWPQPPSAPKNRKPLYITLTAGCVLIMVVAIVFVMTMAGGGGGGQASGTAGDAVKGYLEALARGDAEAALSYSEDQPATKEFLTDEILKRQIAQWPITNVRILNDDSTTAGALGFAMVHVVANFGDKTSDANIQVKKEHGRWKIASAAIKVSPDPGASSGTNAAAKTMTLFGKPIGDSAVYVFPGFTDVGSSNPYLTVTAKPLLLDQLSMSGLGWLQPTFALSDAGHDAANAQLAAAMANCQRSSLLAPPGCPIHLNPAGLVDGTVEWGTADLSQVKMDSFDPYRLVLRFFGEVKVPVSVRTMSGATKQGTVSKFLSGDADMTQTPPGLTFR